MNKFIPPQRWTTHDKLFSSLCALLLCALFAGCGKTTEPAKAAASTGGDSAATPTVDVVKVVSKKLSITVPLPGELQPFEAVSIYPKVTGFVKRILVDRGSRVKTGELLAELVAPEIVSQRAESQAKLQSAESQRIEAAARLASDEATYQRVLAASATPGVVSKNELDVLLKSVEAGRGRVKALQENATAARESLRFVQEMEGYLELRAPFDGVVTERRVHPGALVGPAGGMGAGTPLLRIEKVSQLRLVVPVPEAYVAGISVGGHVNFSVPAQPGVSMSGVVARISHSLDQKTRSMPIELDVNNAAAKLDPGMFAEVAWPVERLQNTLFVPTSAVARTTERTFVIRINQGKTDWIDVKTGVAVASLVEVFGDLKEGDDVVLRGTDELRAGTAVTVRRAPTAASPSGIK